MGNLATLSLQQAGNPGLRLFKIEGDAYEPDLRGRDFLMVAPADRFAYDTDYLLDFGDGEAPFVVTSTGGGFSIRHRNPRYSRWDLTPAEFNRAVRGIVVAEVTVRDERLIRAAHAEWVAA